MNLRSPIIVTVGHIDHGKTTLLDAIRGTFVTKTEAGKITQHVGASYVPSEAIENISGELMKRFKIKLDIPGLLFIDTPGHAAFTSLRKRGGSVADLAILVVDINEGFKEQTYESLKILKEFKVPFVVAATKIDKIPGWYPTKNNSIIESLKEQRDDVIEDLDKKIYYLIASLSEEGFDADKFDRIDDFTKKIAIVPVSGVTKEGLAELLMILSGLSQHYLKGELILSDKAKGSILEVKEERGLGTTVDVILYDGIVRKGDYMIVGTKEPIVTKIRALLRPRPMKELRAEKKFENVDEVKAAAGIKIVAPNLNNVIAGVPVVFTANEKEIEKLKEEVRAEIGTIEFDKSLDGVILKADTIGSLEALVKLCKEEEIIIKKADVGKINREDLVEAKTVSDKYKRVILVFNVKVDDNTIKEAEDNGIKIFQNNVIYRLIEDYKNWVEEEKTKEVKKLLENISRPVEVKVIPGAVFRQSKPAIFGVEVLGGVLKSGTRLKRKDGKVIGKVKEIQSEGRNVSIATKGNRVAISIDEAVIGRNVREGEILVSEFTRNEKELLYKLSEYLSEEEREILKEI